MAEETQQAAQETQSLPTVPDSVLKEIEKVASIEKGLNFVQIRQGVLEKAVSKLEEQNKVEATADVENVISEETKEIEKEEPKEDKNVTKKDKLKPQLDSIEKKRYENIGVEFAKGAEVIFKELEKAKKLQEKMKTSEVKKVEDAQKEEVKEKDEKKKKFSFLKFGLAIATVGAVLYLFRDTVDKFIPGFSDGIENTFGFIKKKAKDIFGTITDGIFSVFRNIFGGVFEGQGGVKHTLNMFFLSTLPDILFRSGLGLIESFGGELEGGNKSLNQIEDTELEKTIKWAEEQQKKQIADLQNRASANNEILKSAFSSAGEIEVAQRQIGLDSVILQGEELAKKMSQITGTNVDNFLKYNEYAGNLMGKIHQENVIGESFSEEQNVKLARVVYEQTTGKKAIDDGGNDTAEFTKWFENNKTGFFNKETWNQLKAAHDEYAKRMTSVTTIRNKGLNLGEIVKQTDATVRKNALKLDEKDNSKIKLNIEPVNIAQDSVAAEVKTLFEDLKALFTGNIDMPDYINQGVKFVNEIINKLIEPLLDTFVEFQNLVIGNTPSKTTGGQWTDQQKDFSQLVSLVGGTSSQSDANSPSAPIVLLDLELDGQVFTQLSSMFADYGKITEQMADTNSKLGAIKNITIVPPAKSKDSQNEGEQESNLIIQNAQKIAVLSNKVSRIESYLESNDKDDNSVSDFTLQAASS